MKIMKPSQLKQENEKFLKELSNKRNSDKDSTKSIYSAPTNREEMFDYAKESADRMHAQQPTTSPSRFEGLKPWEFEREKQKFLREDVPRAAAQRRLDQRQAEGRSWFKDDSREALIKEYREAQQELKEAEADLETAAQELSRIKSSR